MMKGIINPQSEDAMFLLELELLPRIALLVFGITAMLGVGMQSTTGDLYLVLGRKTLFLRTFLANFVVVPIIGILLAKMLPIKQEGGIALLLLACTPGGISALQFTTKIKGASLFAGVCGLLMTFAALFLSPVLLRLALPGYVSVVIPYGRSLLSILVFLLIPFVAGMLVHRRWERPAEKLAKLCIIVSAVAFMVSVGLLMDLRKEAMNAISAEAIIVSLCFIASSMAIGWFMGGPEREMRPVVATITGMRNVILSLVIALSTFPGGAEKNYLVAFSGLMVPPNLLLTAYIIIRSRKAGRATQK
jgi:bile acid:Na+ symporter, BASS family